MTIRQEEISEEVSKVIAQNEKPIRDGFEKAVEDSKADVVLATIAIAVVAADVEAGVQAARIDKFESELSSVTTATHGAFKAGGDSASAELPPNMRKNAKPINLVATNAQEFLNEEGARLVTEISDETRKAIRETMEDVLEKGMPPRRAAKRIKEIIGLTSRQAAAIAKQVETLTAEGVPQATIDKVVARRTKKMIKTRAETIARTEAARAVGAGRQTLWDQLVEDGTLSPDVTKTWITAQDERVGTDHRPMHETTVGIGEAFFIPATGVSVQVPSHSRPRCRCVPVLNFDS